MEYELQKASMWKRIAAAILDLILLAVLATGFGWGLSSALNYNSYSDKAEAIYNQYAERFEIDKEMTQEKYNALSPEEQEAYKAKVAAADEAISTDDEAAQTYTKLVSMSLIVVTGAVLLSVLVLQLAVPLIFGNGQTVGKKVFALCLVRKDSVKLNNLQLFTRAILGKFAIELMIPVYVMLMMFLGLASIIQLGLVVILLLVQLICLGVTQNNTVLHDLMAGTVVVEYTSQRIFQSTEELQEYQKRIAAERAARQTY